MLSNDQQQAATILQSNAQRIVLIGPSGCGKSHVRKLHEREGDIVIEAYPDYADHEPTILAGWGLHINEGRRLIVEVSGHGGYADMFSDRVASRLGTCAQVPIGPWSRSEVKALLMERGCPPEDAWPLSRVTASPCPVIGWALKAAHLGWALGLCAIVPAEIPRVAIDAAARHYGVSVERLLGPSRTRTNCAARHVAIYAMRQVAPSLTLESIGAAVGGRDHSTVLHAINKIERLLADGCAETRAAVDAVRADVG